MNSFSEFEQIKECMKRYEYFVKVTNSFDSRAKSISQLLSSAANRFTSSIRSVEIDALTNGHFSIESLKGCFAPVQYLKYDLYVLTLSLKIREETISIQASVLEHNRPGSPLEVRELKAITPPKTLSTVPILKIFDSAVLSQIKDVGDIDRHARPPFDPMIINQIATLLRKTSA